MVVVFDVVTNLFNSLVFKQGFKGHNLFSVSIIRNQRNIVSLFGLERKRNTYDFGVQHIQRSGFCVEGKDFKTVNFSVKL